MNHEFRTRIAIEVGTPPLAPSPDGRRDERVTANEQISANEIAQYETHMNKGKIFFVILFSLLVLPNLGTRPLWQDEAETALVAKQMINSNVWLPYAYDDQGPISQDWNYQFKISSLWRWHPWLQFYVTALSFKLLGISAFSARLPFALLGIAAYWYFLNFLTRHIPSLPARQSLALQAPAGGRAPRSLGEVGRGNLVFFLTAAVLFLLSVPLLLHLRQARYYSLSLFFTLLTIDGYLNIYQTNTKGMILKGYSLKYLMGSIFLFHSFLPSALALQISFWIHQIRSLLACHAGRRAERQGDSLIKIKGFAISFSTTLVFTLPWAVWLKIGGQNLNFSPDLIKQHLIQHYLYIHKFIFPVFVLIPLIFTRFSLNLLSKLANLRVRLLPSEATPSTIYNVRAGDGERANFANEIASENIVLFSIFISISLLLYTFNHPYFFRYLIPLIPLFIYIAAWIIANTKPVWSLIPLIFLILMTVKTFPKYLTEISHPYQTANAEIINFLTSLDPQKYQELAVNYDDFTFRFHTSLTVYGAQHLNLTFLTSRWPEGTIFEVIEEEPNKTFLLDFPRGDDEVSEDTKPSVPKKWRRGPSAFICPDIIIIFPDWGNEEQLREISRECQLTPHPLPLHYAKLADDPDPTNHRFTQPPLRTLEVFLAPPSPS